MAGWDRDRYNAAAFRQQNERRRERLLRTGTPVPARITMALDLRELYGPEVDRACGAEEPDVDRWEDPDDELLPTAEQVRLLATLTDFPVDFFYLPIPESMLNGTIWMCGPRGCEAVPAVPVPPGLANRGPVQSVLFTPAPPVEKKPPAARPRPAPKPVPPPAAAPTLPAVSGRMPEHLRAKLLAKIEASRNRRK